MRCWENDHRLHLVYSQVVAVCPDCGLKMKDGCSFFFSYHSGGVVEPDQWALDLHSHRWCHLEIILVCIRGVPLLCQASPMQWVDL